MVSISRTVFVGRVVFCSDADTVCQDCMFCFHIFVFQECLFVSSDLILSCQIIRFMFLCTAMAKCVYQTYVLTTMATSYRTLLIV